MLIDKKAGGIGDDNDPEPFNPIPPDEAIANDGPADGFVDPF